MACHIALGKHKGRRQTGVACPRRLWKAHTVDDSGHDMPSMSLDNTNGQTISGSACYHDPWMGHTVRQRLVWHAFLALRLHTQKDDVGLAML